MSHMGYILSEQEHWFIELFRMLNEHGKNYTLVVMLIQGEMEGSLEEGSALSAIKGRQDVLDIIQDSVNKAYGQAQYDLFDKIRLVKDDKS